MSSALLVFIGGGAGSLCRWALGLALQPLALRFPLATLLANGAACFVLGLVLGLQGGPAYSEQKRLLLGVGFCGGFSTFSTFTAETWQLWQQGAGWTALANMFLSLLVCFVCLFWGLKMTS